MSGSNCCFLTCLQISQEAGQVVWYSHLPKNFPQVVVIHIVKVFGVVNKTEVDVFWSSLAFLMIQWMLAIWCLVPLAYKSSLNIWKFTVHVLLKPGLENFEHYFASTWSEVKSVSHVWLCDPMDYSLSGSSVHGIFQARVLEWAAISFSRGPSLPRDLTRVSCIVGRCFILQATREAHEMSAIVR